MTQTVALSRRLGRHLGVALAVATLAPSLVAASPIALGASPDPAGTVITPLETLWEAGGPALDPDEIGTMAMDIDPLTGNLWVAVPHADRYWILSPDGEFLGEWGESGSGPGQFRFESPAQTVPSAVGAIAFAPDGSFYVGDLGNFRVQHFGPDRGYLGEWGSFGREDGQFLHLWSIATDGTSVLVGDCGRWDTQVFTPTGEHVRTLKGDVEMCFVTQDDTGIIHGLGRLPDGSGALVRSTIEGDELGRLPITGYPGTPWSVTPLPDGGSLVSLTDETTPGHPHVGLLRVGPDWSVVARHTGGADRMLVDPAGDAVYLSSGVDALSPRWEVVRKVRLPEPR